MTMGEKIKQYRKEAGLTQEQLAKAIGAATVTIRQYETDKRQPKSQILFRLADALHLPNPAWLMFDPLPDEDEKRPAEAGQRDELIRLFEAASPEFRAAALALLRSAEVQAKAQGDDPADK